MSGTALALAPTNASASDPAQHLIVFVQQPAPAKQSTAVALISAFATIASSVLKFIPIP